MRDTSYDNNSFLGTLLAIVAIAAIAAAAVFGYMWFTEDSGTSTVINMPETHDVVPVETPAAPAIENPTE